jgi:hypothetical protein
MKTPKTTRINSAMADLDNDETRENAIELIKFSVISVGTYLSTKLLLRMVKNHVLLFGTGVLAGIYVHKNRKEILNTLSEAKRQTVHLLEKSRPDA